MGQLFALHAHPMITLPDPWDPALAALELAPGSPYEYLPGMALCDGFSEAWRKYCWRAQNLGDEQAFGWPRLLAANPLPEDRQLLQLPSGDPWGEWSEGGGVNFMISDEALRTGDFTEVMACPNGW